MGFVSEVFRDEFLEGRIGIGHNRYSNAGLQDVDNAAAEMGINMCSFRSYLDNYLGNEIEKYMPHTVSLIYFISSKVYIETSFSRYRLIISSNSFLTE